MNNKVTPRVWKARCFAGQGFDQYGKSRDGDYYCDFQTAIDLENELIKANKEISRLKKKYEKTS